MGLLTKYVFSIDSTTGQVQNGTTLNYPDSYTVDGDENVWANQGRSFYDSTSKTWTIYDELTLTLSEASGTTADTIVATVQLPSNSPDTSVEFDVSYVDTNGQQTTETPITEAVANGQAQHSFQFTVAGTYVVTVKSGHCGAVSQEVTISAA